ncbi:5'-3' exonuclease H3TH domain-containing protein [Cellulomonas sp. HD19AZ1]|uniref:5'-3' exonuclease n=1 Tax=Cellulomonas sp. HD19AZ1 TaxID=2559593 RepID=UPI001071134E|nr:5'-3' exonuclease H3TH domain-containing protein [Cellulomonas sp. HD19AZ1]TFH69934.1 5'-3' exonuclease [Cellulomonas sp. HD19AZ1]
MTKTLLAVDGNSLIHRAYHAGAASGTRTRDGRPTWAVRGALSQVLGACDRVSADAVVVGFDDASHNVRKTVHPEYKSHRAEKPTDLVEQLALAADVFRDAGLHVVTPPGHEADDVLASAAAHADAAGWRTVVCTSDRDAFALITPTTSVLRLINGGVEASPVLTPERLRLMIGIDPAQYRQFAAMRGDASDNLAGIRGIGEKTGVALLTAFGTVEAAFADVDEHDGARVAAEVGKAVVRKLADPEGRAAYRRNVELMTMRTDLDLRLDLAASPCPGVLPLDATTLHRALAGAELDSLQWLAHRTLVSWDAEPPWRTSGARVAPGVGPAPAAPPAAPGPVAAAPAPVPAPAAAAEDDVLTLF